MQRRLINALEDIKVMEDKTVLEKRSLALLESGLN
jgi:DNA-directed RNA polymerase beta' subunit